MKKIDLENSYPLLDSQTGIYLECLSNPGTTKYNIGAAYYFPKDIDTAKLIDALYSAVDEYKVLGTVIETPDGIPSMKYVGFKEKIEVKDIDDIYAESDRINYAYDLEKGPLLRLEICNLKDSVAVLLNVHHIIADGTSLNVFLKAVIDSYKGEEIKKEDISIFDFSEVEQQEKDSDLYNGQLDYFDKKYDGLDLDLNPVSDISDPDIKPGSGQVDLNVSGVKYSDILKYAKDNKVTENSFFLAAFSYALAKYSGTNESCFATAYHGRKNKGLADTFGMFVKTLPIYSSFSEDEEISGYISGISDEFYNVKHKDLVSFGTLAEKYGMNNNITFVFQTDLLNGQYLDDKLVRLEMLPFKEPIVDLDVMIMRSGDNYSILAHFQPNVYSSDFVKSFTALYSNVIRQMLSKKYLKDIELVTDGQKDEINALNKTECGYEDDKTVLDLFKIQVESVPDNICVVSKDKKYTYREVDELTDRIAKYLISVGITKEKVVGVLIPRCEHMVICSLAALKAGGAYLPLDPTYPPERLNLMVQDSNAAVLIYSKEFASIIDDNFKGVRIATDELESIPDKEAVLPKVLPTDLFVLLYTSGSTGIPKGVMFNHSNTMVTAVWVRKYYGLNPESRVTSYASYGFDAHAYDIYPALISGAAIHIITDDIRLDFIALQKYFNDNKITHTVMTTQVGRQFALMGGLKTLKHLSVAGEKLTPVEIHENFNLYNLYGPTEGSIITSAFKMEGRYKDVPIGKAVENLKLYVVDKLGRLLPTGGVGELWISGPHVTRGYLNRPEKTAEAYGLNSFIQEKGYERVYKTGDIVRLLADGNLQFVGRRDAQVKVRGFRVELTEVEEVIRRFEGIEDATVAAFEDKGGGKYIAAYIVSEKEIDISALEEFIRSEKPPYMVPAITMQIDKIPLNQNQKVNKKALPVPVRKTISIVPPETEMQKRIFNVISKVIGHGEFGIDNDIYEVGLTSIGAVKLNVDLAKEFDAVVKISDIKENNTILKLEKFLGKSSEKTTFDILPDYPITQTQQGIFIECTRNPNSITYNMPVIAKLDGSIDLQRLKIAIEKALDAHPYSKAVLFANSEGDIRAKRNDGLAVDIKITKTDKVDTGSLVYPFELLNSQLFRIEIFEASDGKYLFMDFHHIISDGTSEGILIKDIERAYLGETLTVESYTGFEAALDEEISRRSPKYTKAKEFYDSIFLGCESESLPPKSPEGDAPTAAKVVRKTKISLDKVNGFVNENKLSVSALFNAAFGFTLSNFGINNDAVFTTVYNGRNDSRLLSSLTMLVKTLPVLVRTEENRKVVDLIAEVKNQLIGLMAHDIYSFAEVSRAYGIKADIIFVYQGDDFDFDTMCGKPAEFTSLLPSVAKAPISINVNLTKDGFEFVSDYLENMYSGDYISSLLECLEQAVNEFLIKEKLSDVILLTESQDKLLGSFNDTEAEAVNFPITELFEKEVEKHPDKLATISNGVKFTYGEVNKMANQIARKLISLGVKSDEIVGLMVDRSVKISIIELGILKAGGAFLGLLPSYPDDRLDYTLADSDCRYVISTKDIIESRTALFSEDKKYTALDFDELITGPDSNVDVDIPMDSLAYCIYTSGSTGKPKGVLIEHHNLTSCVLPRDHIYSYYCGSNSGDVALAISSITFDMSIIDNIQMLVNGFTVVIATEEEIHNPNRLARLLIENNVDTIATTPSFLTNYLTIEEFIPAIKGLKRIVVGAESFQPSLYTNLKKINKDVVIINGYGPSECTITCCAKLLESEKNITIGKPCANTAFYVLDRFGNILPKYGVGELIISGELVGRGYANLPEKTKASFFKLRGLNSYHSGDTVRLNRDGEVEFFGRIDNQVKVRGFRIELDEIEKVITQFEGVKQSKVIVRNNGQTDYLVGFFTAKTKVDTAALTAYLKSKLTYYMVPDAMMQLDSMPLTPSGKIDKKALPEIKKEKKEKRAPKRSLEEELCELFKSILNLEEFYVDDNFFENGGTSLNASKATMQLMSKGIKVEYQDIFDNPTPEMLARYIERNSVTLEKTEEKEKEKNDVDEMLKYNTLEYAGEVTREPLGDVLLTGAVGFLGIHVLRELIEKDEGKVICIVRKGDVKSPETRLKHMLMYYFGETFEKEFGSRIQIVDADITDSGLTEKLKDVTFDTLINCAACVKHYAADDIIEKINVTGVENLIALTKSKSAKMIQISTTSVPGVHTAETYKVQLKMHENELFVVDAIDNKYCISKYHAELKMLEAIKSGMRGKIIRVGNLMGRYSDGEFQINFNTNAFLHALRGFATIGKCPISHSTDPMSFSPIDLTAKAVVLLAGTNDKFTAFHADNRFGFDEMQLIEACNRCGITIKPVQDKEYYDDYYRMLGNEKINSKLSGLVTNDRPDLHMVDTDNVFTANILYRLGFSWPLIDLQYLERALESLLTLDYFEPDDAAEDF